MTYQLKKSPVTCFFLVLTILVFLAMQYYYGQAARTPQAVFHFGGMFGLAVKATPSQIWRLLTPIFVHIGWQHFLLNTLTLFYIGQLAEKIWGSKNFFLLYLLSGVMGNLLTLQLSPGVVAAGASTSLFGIFAAIMVLGIFSENPQLRTFGKSYQTLIILNLVMNIFMPNVSLAGHLGGVLGGGLAAIFLSNQVAPLSVTKKQKLLAILVYGIISTLILVGIFI
ncbi:rhomboid family intramembrane serine protease [Streptococcus pseudoporcinus]|uniref:Rhomboid family membrane protein n=1 Tax=Streptococcus pseudoporcinus TaxID=361101 RepID=A0A4U9YEK6_9STRE|nr:rhomboid family intramembrane serine protease [Streptococcus pseudoporcinus]VTS24788.1 rhomboid family membrane protein [Streptococcus pseudoporcinus]VUC71154.1 rhomboid family membrane protein [Streptococcus pseudoporcinus]VUD00700.1 rhomboid family membrane protein [Streptococcus pseudoporcinus]VUD01042.1 rhomboid family membrane protein [Streptococcus pseudoporcinus]